MNKTLYSVLKPLLPYLKDKQDLNIHICKYKKLITFNSSKIAEIDDSSLDWHWFNDLTNLQHNLRDPSPVKLANNLYFSWYATDNHVSAVVKPKECKHEAKNKVLEEKINYDFDVLTFFPSDFHAVLAIDKISTANLLEHIALLNPRKIYFTAISEDHVRLIYQMLAKGISGIHILAKEHDFINQWIIYSQAIGISFATAKYVLKLNFDL